MTSRSVSPPPRRRLKVAFLHPDLGLGGAERLVVDAALGLANLGHDVTMFTSHYNPDRCFEETKLGKFGVKVYGDFLPRHVAGKGHILFSTVRNLWLAARVAARMQSFDVFICDQISACVPLLRVLCPQARILFYCHHPDLLLVQPGGSWLKRLYRIPFDLLEETTTGLSHHIVVNSAYTGSVFHSTFHLLSKVLGVKPGVLHPCMEMGSEDGLSPSPTAPTTTFLSINRFERKKAVHLALEALGELRNTVAPEAFATVRLIIAGGCDPRVAENVEYHDELVARAKELRLLPQDAVESALPTPSSAAGGLRNRKSGGSGGGGGAGTPPSRPAQVKFMRSFSDEEKKQLLSDCTAVLYTPSFEHFGIVPLETMAALRPVIAVNNGGPLETIEDGETGFLVPPDAKSFAGAMKRFVDTPELATKMGRQGRDRVGRLFSRAAFAASLESTCVSMAEAPAPWTVGAWLAFLTYMGVMSFMWLVVLWCGVNLLVWM